LNEAVVDASVAAKWVLDEDHSAQAARLLSLPALYAPAHWLAETLHALSTMVLRGELTPEQAKERAGVLLLAPVRVLPLAGLAQSALSIAVAARLSGYDALYVALAHLRGIPLVTADRKLIGNLARGGAAPGLVMWIGDVV
jgi:predicted nucleic acid-binding protein